MSVRTKRLQTVEEWVRHLRRQETTHPNAIARRGYWFSRWSLMLYHEFLVDDVRIRAESLSFLMVFSLLPLIAGCFFVFAIFAQFSMVQDTLQGFVNRFLMTIPAEHREFVYDYVIRFKDAYLSSITSKSGAIGIFAVFILMWVGLKMFNNIDKTLNHIWSSNTSRPLWEQIRNFLVVAVAAPIVLVGGLSVPLILQKVTIAQFLWTRFPVLLVFMNHIMAPLMIVLTFTMLYRYVPVRRVKWKSALIGGIFSSLFLELSNAGIQLYFRIGTNSAYGKAAAIPLMGFWIYVVWIIVIMGAELSFLIQNEKDILDTVRREPTFREGECTLLALYHLYRAHKSGNGVVGFEDLRELTRIDTTRLHRILDYLHEKSLCVEVVAGDSETLEGSFALATDLSNVTVKDFLAEYYCELERKADSPLQRDWRESFKTWMRHFKQGSLSQYFDQLG